MAISIKLGESDRLVTQINSFRGHPRIRATIDKIDPLVGVSTYLDQDRMRMIYESKRRLIQVIESIVPDWGIPDSTLETDRLYEEMPELAYSADSLVCNYADESLPFFDQMSRDCVDIKAALWPSVRAKTHGYLLDFLRENPNLTKDNILVLIEISIKNNEFEVLEFLMEHGLDLAKVSFNWTTPLLFFAALTVNVELLKFLKKHGVDFAWQNQTGISILHIAAIRKSPDLIRYIVKQCESLLYSRTAQSGFIPLHLAVLFRMEISVIKTLTTNKTLNIADGFGNTPIHYAVRKENVEAVDFFLKQKDIAIDFRNKAGFTPFALSAGCRNGRITKKLMLRDAEYNEVLPGGITPVMLAARMDNSAFLEAIEKDQGYGLKVAHDALGNTALHYASACGSANMVKCILTCVYILKTSRNQDGILPIEFADRNVLTKILELEGKIFPLHWSIREICLPAFSILVQEKDVNEKDDMGSTPMTCALVANRFKMATVLLMRGAIVPADLQLDILNRFYQHLRTTRSESRSYCVIQ